MKTNTKPMLLLAVGLLATMGSTAVAQNGTATTTNQANGAAGQISHADRMFMMKAEQSNIAEIKSSQLALNKASTQGLKDFAQHMIDDHTAAENDLKELAQDDGHTLPSDTDAKNRMVGARLMKLSGAAFDSAYGKAQHDGHVATIAVFKKEIANGSDPDVKAYAQKYLPKIQGHLEDLNAMGIGVKMHHSAKMRASGMGNNQ